MNVLRILYHHRTLADGAEGIHIEEMVRAFRDLGHEVRVVSLATSAGDEGRGLASRLKAVLPGPVLELLSMAANLPEYLAARRHLRRFRPNLVYKRHARYDIGTALAARHCGVPIALEVNALFSAAQYSHFEPLFLPSVVRALERRVLKLATVVIAVSTPLAGQIQNLSGITALMLPNGADPKRFDPDAAVPEAVRERHGLRGAFVIGWIGILREWHGLGVLLAAINEIPDAKLLVVGDGPARTALEAMARSLGVSDRVVVTGRVPHSSVLHYIAAMDVCVVADERTGVASPMKLVEYMSMTRAVAAPNLDNLRDLIVDEVDGLLFEPADSHDLARVLRRLTNRQLREQLGQTARLKVLSRLNWRANARSVLSHCVDRGIPIG